MSKTREEWFLAKIRKHIAKELEHLRTMHGLLIQWRDNAENPDQVWRMSMHINKVAKRISGLESVRVFIAQDGRMVTDPPLDSLPEVGPCNIMP